MAHPFDVIESAAEMIERTKQLLRLTEERLRVSRRQLEQSRRLMERVVEFEHCVKRRSMPRRTAAPNADQNRSPRGRIRT